MLDDATLVGRCRAGDELAWEALVRRHQGRIYGLAVHYMRNSEEARDVAQDVFVRIYRKLGSYDGAEFKPWMLQLARNACIDRLRRIKARPPARDVPVGDGFELTAPGRDPEQDSGLEERKRLLHRAIRGLSEKYREVLILKDIQGMKFEEIAAILDVPIGTLKSRSNRARIQLAERVRALDPSYGTTAG